MASLLPKLNPELTGVNPETGEYMSPEQRKTAFKLRKRKLDPSKVFGKSAIVKVDKPQANMDSIVQSITRIQETLNKISNFIFTEAEEKKKETTKENRQLLLAGEKEERKKKEGLLEKVPERLKSALLAPIKAVGKQAQGILSKLMEAFTLIFTGWLVDKGLKAIEAFMGGDKDKLKNIGKNVISALTIVGGILVGMNLAMLALPALIMKAIAVIGTLGGAILGFLLSPVGLATIAILGGIGATLFGMKGIKDAITNQITGGSSFTKKHEELDKILKDLNIRRVGKTYRVFTGSERQIMQGKGSRRELNEEEQKILEDVIRQRKLLNETHIQMDKELDQVAGSVPMTGERRQNLRGQKSKIIKFHTQDELDLIEQKKNAIKEKYLKLIDNNFITTNNNNLSNKNLSSPEVTQEVVINNKFATERGDNDLKTGSATNIPFIASSNSDNFYTLFSQTQYGVVV